MLLSYLDRGCRTTTTRKLFSARVFQSRLCHDVTDDNDDDGDADDDSDKFRANWPQL